MRNASQKLNENSGVEESDRSLSSNASDSMSNSELAAWAAYAMETQVPITDDEDDTYDKEEDYDEDKDIEDSLGLGFC